MIATRNESAALRFSIGTIGFAAAIVLLFVSAAMNYRFGYTLGRTPEDGHIYGMAAMAADVFKAVGPFIFFAAWRSRQMPVFWASLVIWLVMLTFGLAGAAGHAALNRLDTASQRVGTATSYQDTRTELLEARKERGFIPQHRPEATVRAELEKHKTKALWSQTTECAEVAGPRQREYCAQYQTLNAELGYAMRAAKLDQRIEKLTEKSDKIGATTGGVQSDADPQAAVLSRLSGLDLPATQIALILLIVAVLEVGGGLGPYAALSYMFGRRPAEVLEAELVPAETATATGAPQLPPPAVPALVATPVPEKQTPIPEKREPVPEPTLEPVTIAIPPRLILLPGAEAWLRHKNFQLEPPRSGHPREWPSTKYAGDCFACWLRAHDLIGPYSHDQIMGLWNKCCVAYHREQMAWNVLKPQFEKIRGVEWKKVRIDGKESPRPVRWFISSSAADIRKFAKPDPNQEAAPDPGHRPLAPSAVSVSLEAANDDAPVPMPIRKIVRAANVPAYVLMNEIAMAREMKRTERGELHRSRKQRGNRIARMARAA